jgi:hypothetical protein
MITTGISGENQRMSNPLNHRGSIKNSPFLGEKCELFMLPLWLRGFDIL